MPATAVAQPYTPPAVQGDVISLYAQGTSKRKISKELGIARATVDNILARYSQTEPKNTTRLQRILPKAYDAVESAVTRGDARIAMDLLKATDLAVDKSDRWSVAGDVTVQQHLTLLPSASTPSTTSPAESTVSTGTEAAAKPPQSDMSLSSQTNFSAFSTEQLEQELARRRAATVIEAEVVK